MLSGAWVYLVGLAAAFGIAVVSSPAGVSGAVLLLPFQVSVLGTPSPAVTPTNLLYNIVATPGAIYRYWRQGQIAGGRLARLLVAGTLPGVIIGSVVRVKLVPGHRAFDVVIALVLIPLGTWLALGRPTPTRLGGGRALTDRALVALSVIVGSVGGVYGIGGGSILAPVLMGSGREASEVAPATLVATLITSIAGVTTFLVLSTRGHVGSVAPDWGTGLALGIGGLAGGYVGARLQPRLPEIGIRRALGLLALAIGARYAWLGAG